MQRFTGYLYKIIECHDHAPCSHRYDFVPLNGDPIEGVTNEAGAPCRKLISAAFDGKKLVNYDVEVDTQPWTDERKKNIALVRYRSPGSFDEADELQKVEKAAKGLEQWLIALNATGGYRWNEIKVTPYFLATDEINAGPSSMNLGQFEAELRAQNDDIWDEHNYFHTWGGSVGGGVLGLAGQNWNRAWSAVHADFQVICHETGHNLGCDHSSTPQFEYRPSGCTMGHGKHTGLCAPQLAAIDLISDEHIVRAENNTRYFLAPAETQQGAMRNGEVKIVGALYSGVTTGYITLSTRMPSEQHRLGYGSNPQGAFDPIVYIDETRTGFNYNPTERGTIQKGQQRTFDDLIVKYVGHHEGVVELEVGNAPPAPYPMPLPPEQSDPIESRHSGIWRNPAFKHQGLFLIVNEAQGKVEGYLYTHYPRGDRREGLISISSNTWPVLQGEIDTGTNTINFTMFDSAGQETRECGHGRIKRYGDQMVAYTYSDLFGRDVATLARLTEEPDGPVEVRADQPFDGYTRGKFGGEYVAVHFTTGRGSELKWAIYMGTDPDQLNGWGTEGSYKQAHVDEVSPAPGLDYTSLDQLELQFTSGT